MVGKDVPVSKEKDTWPTRGLAGEVPSALKQLPSNLEGDKSLPCASSKREQDPLPVVRNGLHDLFDGDVLVVSWQEISASVLKWDCRKPIAPGVGLGKRHVPEFVWRRIPWLLALLAGLHVDPVDPLTVCRVSPAESELRCVVLRLCRAFCQRQIPCLGLVHSQFAVAILQNVVSKEWLAAPAMTFDASRTDRVFSQDTASFDYTPASSFQRWIDVLGSGVGFVHAFMPIFVVNAASSFDDSSLFRNGGFMVLAHQKLNPITFLISAAESAFNGSPFFGFLVSHFNSR